MWSLFVVIAPPGFQDGTGVRQRFEQRLVQQLVAQAAVEALDEAVLLRFAGRDVVPADAGRIRPAQDRVRGQPASEVQETPRSRTMNAQTAKIVGDALTIG
jgi:hypothetical protein